MSNWAKLKVAELKAELRNRGLAQAGLKAELVARLQADDEAAHGAAHQQVQNPDEPVPGSQEAERQEAQPADGGGPEPAAQLPGGYVKSKADKANERVESEGEPALAEQGDGALAAAHNSIDTPSAMPANASNDRDKSLVDEHKPFDQDCEAHDPPITEPAATEPAAPGPFDRTSMADHLYRKDDADDMAIAVDALKRKRRSASPTPKQEVMKRRRAQEGAEDAVDESLAPAGTAYDSPGLDKVASGPQHMRKPSVAAAKDDEFDLEPLVEEIEPPYHASTPAIYINNLMRPMREVDLRTHLVDLSTPPGGQRNDDAIVKFYVDSIRTHAFVVLDSASTALRVRHRLHGRVWPRESNRKSLFVDFVPLDKVDSWISMEQSHSREKKAGLRWEVVYQSGRDGSGVEATLQSTSVTSASSAGHLTGRVAAGVEGAPTGPRGYRPPAPPPAYPRPMPSDQADPRGRRLSPSLVSRRQRSPSHAEGLDEQRTMAEPPLYFQPVAPALAHRRLQDMRSFYNGDSTRQPGSDINRYSFQDGDRFVDRGREVFEGIRPPRRQQAVDRERGLLGNGGGRSGRPPPPFPRRGPAPFHPRSDRYMPGSGWPGDGRPPPRTAW